MNFSQSRFFTIPPLGWFGIVDDNMGTTGQLIKLELRIIISNIRCFWAITLRKPYIIELITKFPRKRPYIVLELDLRFRVIFALKIIINLLNFGFYLFHILIMLIFVSIFITEIVFGKSLILLKEHCWRFYSMEINKIQFKFVFFYINIVSEFCLKVNWYI